MSEPSHGHFDARIWCLSVEQVYLSLICPEPDSNLSGLYILWKICHLKQKIIFILIDLHYMEPTTIVSKANILG